MQKYAKNIKIQTREAFNFLRIKNYICQKWTKYWKMNAEEIRIYCLKKAETTESFPFDETTLVFKVKNKMFALFNLEEPLSINLKCEPEKAIELREHYPSVLPGYHMNKQNWNTVMLDKTISDNLLKQWIDDSYWLVVETLPKKDRAGLERI